MYIILGQYWVYRYSVVM